MANNNQFCDNQDNLVTTFFCEVVTLLCVGVRCFRQFVTTKTTSLRDTCVRMRTCAHVREYVVTYVTSCFLIKNSISYVVTTCFFKVVIGCLGCHKGCFSWGWL